MKIKLADGRKVELNGPEHMAEVRQATEAHRQAETLRTSQATDAQTAYLRGLGVKIPAGLTKSNASRLISEAKARQVDLGYGEDHGDDAVRPHEYEGGLSSEAY